MQYIHENPEAWLAGAVILHLFRIRARRRQSRFADAVTVPRLHRFVDDYPPLLAYFETPTTPHSSCPSKAVCLEQERALNQATAFKSSGRDRDVLAPTACSICARDALSRPYLVTQPTHTLH